MTQQELKQRYTEAITDLSKCVEMDRIAGYKMMLPIYLRMFGEMPQLLSTDQDKVFRADREEGDEEEEGDYIDANKTLRAIYEKYKDECYLVRNFDEIVLVMDHAIISADETSIYGCYKEDYFPKDFMDSMVNVKTENTCYMHYVTNSGNGFNTMSMEVKKQDCDIKLNYNDDFPYEKLISFINSEESGIVVLNGNPGTGKTSLLRHLIYEVDRKHQFVFLDSSVFNYITDASFVKLLMDYRNAVIVLEDCETLLASRERGNGSMAALLNLSDGILGDSLNLKFICTFNSDLTKIDPALLRKGRMKLKYEFKPLKATKVQVLAKNLGKDIPEGKDMCLCDIYNFEEDNGVKNDKKPIGFGY